MQITLVPIDRCNWEACVRLSAAPSQRGFVAANAYSLAEAAYEPDRYPAGICRDGQLVGFLLCAYDRQLAMWGLYRLMVDQAFQRQGIGEAALRLLLQNLAERLGPLPFFTSAKPENAVAIALYQKLGFRPDGRIIEGEVLLVTTL